MKKDFTRDVSPNMIDLLSEGGLLYPFTEFVKERGNELALCFRGNDSNTGTVTIYKNNHCIWNLKCSGKDSAKIEISLNHARFTHDWDTRVVKILMDCGFRPSSNKSYGELIQDKELVTRGKTTKNGKTYYSYNAIKLFAEIDGEKTKAETIINGSFKILDEIQHTFLNEEKPTNYIKQYYKKRHPVEFKEDCNQKTDSNPQPCIEKRVQQDLFMQNHYFDNGFFIYDSEFKQPKGVTLINGGDKDLKNTPDLFGIRFEFGKPVAICMIEVKSTESALNGTSGVKMHLDGMKKYMSLKRSKSSGEEIRLMRDRKDEARIIIGQYEQLGLYDVPRDFLEKFSEEYFRSLDEEIFFVFTNGIDLETVIKDEKKYVKDVLKNYELYNYLKSGDVSREIYEKTFKKNCGEEKKEVCVVKII